MCVALVGRVALTSDRGEAGSHIEVLRRSGCSVWNHRLADRGQGVVYGTGSRTDLPARRKAADRRDRPAGHPAGICLVRLADPAPARQPRQTMARGVGAAMAHLPWHPHKDGRGGSGEGNRCPSRYPPGWPTAPLHPCAGHGPGSRPVRSEANRRPLSSGQA